jgi:hypothetical protein
MDNKKLTTIPGYVHPEKTVISRGNKYKTFTEGQKPKKKEKFGSVLSGNQYASYNIPQNIDKNSTELSKERSTYTMQFDKHEEK